MRDILRATSDTYSPNVFGLTSLPYIRGQEGEVFYNGIRRGGGNNGYGLPFSFNPVESIDVVKGPATPVYGATQRVGGYVNLVTKQPYFDDLAHRTDRDLRLLRFQALPDRLWWAAHQGQTRFPGFLRAGG